MEKKQNQTQYNVPLELFADIHRILSRNKISIQIVGTKSRTNVIVINANYTIGNTLHLKAQENTESLISDFGEYMQGLSESVIYSEESE